MASLDDPMEVLFTLARNEAKANGMTEGREHLVVDGILDCILCREKLPVPTDVTISEVLTHHRKACRIKTTTRVTRQLWADAEKELDELADKEVSDIDERRALLREMKRLWKLALDHPQMIEKEVEISLMRSAGVSKRERITWVEGKPVRIAETPSEVMTKGWEAFDGKWRRAENLPDGTPVWVEYPSTEDGSRPNPKSKSSRHVYPRNETRKQLKQKRNGV